MIELSGPHNSIAFVEHLSKHNHKNSLHTQQNTEHVFKEKKYVIIMYCITQKLNLFHFRKKKKNFGTRPVPTVVFSYFLAIR